ncbi:hypothetical protein Bca101_100919 [Brassica carinata]
MEVETAKECVTTHLPNQLAPKWMALKRDLYPPPGKSQASMSRRARRSLQNLGREPGGAPPVQILVVVANIQMRTLKAEEGKACPLLETAQPEVGSSGWKSTARRVVSVHSRALENPEDRKPPRPVALITASGLQGEQPLAAGSGSQFNPPTVGGLLEPLTWRATASSAGDGLGTALSSFPAPNSQLRTEIQPSAVNGRSNYDSLKLNHSQGNGLGRISGKEDLLSLTLVRLYELNENRNLVVEQKGKSSLDSDFQYEYEPDNWLVAAKPLIATLLFDPSMSALPIIVKQNSPSVGLFTHQ